MDTAGLALHEQLDRIESRLNQLWGRVDTLERRASFWGALGGGLAVLLTRLAGCV